MQLRRQTTSADRPAIPFRVWRMKILLPRIGPNFATLFVFLAAAW
jgi:hypothetical protein